MERRLGFLPRAIDKNSIISEGRRHILNQQNSLRPAANTDENSRDEVAESPLIPTDGLELPTLKRVITETSLGFLSASNGVSKLLYELKYISLSIRSVPCRRIEIATDSLYYNMHNGTCAYASPPGFFLIPPPTILQTLQSLKLDQKLNTNWPEQLVRAPEGLIKLFREDESDPLSQVTSTGDLDKVDSICDNHAESFLKTNSSLLDTSSITEYHFLRISLKFKAARKIFERKLFRLIPTYQELNINVIELLLLRPECNYMSRNTCIGLFQSKCKASGQIYSSRDLSLSWRVLTLAFTVILLKEERRINDCLKPDDCRLTELFTSHNIRKYLNTELYNYNGTTTAPCFYRSLWSLVSTHASLQLSVQPDSYPAHASKSCEICSNIPPAFPIDLQSVIQKVLATQVWGGTWKVTNKPLPSDGGAKDHTDQYMASLNELRTHSLQHLNKQCLLDDWVIASWKNQEMKNHLTACEALVKELRHLPKPQLVEIITTVAVRGTRKALRSFLSYHLWANNADIDSDLIFAQYCLLFNKALILDMVSQELDELRWKKKLRLNMSKNNMLALHRACPVAWLCLPSEEFQMQFDSVHSSILHEIQLVTFSSSGVFDKLIQNHDIPTQEKLDRMQSIIPNVPPGVLDRCLYYAQTKMIDSTS